MRYLGRSVDLVDTEIQAKSAAGNDRQGHERRAPVLSENLPLHLAAKSTAHLLNCLVFADCEPLKAPLADQLEFDFTQQSRLVRPASKKLIYLHVF
jgi:hypothetical protein